MLLLGGLAFFVAPLTGFGQSSATDSTLLVASVKSASSHYTAAISNNSELFNGPEYVFYNKALQKTKGHPFFETDQPQKGSVLYNGASFSDVPLLYDIKLDQLITFYPVSLLKIQLITPSVGSFSVNNHSFIYLSEDKEANFTAGFYELLVSGEASVIARRVKETEKSIQGGQIEYSFIERDKYYIRYNEKPSLVSSAADITRLFPDQKKELQKFVKSNRLRFKKNSREKDMIQLVSYYNALSK
ncbi:hypothetical protein Hsw_1848 [Hymenobacter swuensis DY53]|uniref:Uncharacterized protein n=2 Tax=Hymenobacter TaxID=89966 RepID=W8EY21_9BACT|nr:hypothetical protein Hsw_1848 [Hymenobacter swuensis DY53]